MTVSEAVSEKIGMLLKERNMSAYKLALNSGVLHGTLNAILKNKNKSVNLAIMIQIAGGFGMEVWEFLNDPLFREENLKV